MNYRIVKSYPMNMTKDSVRLYRIEKRQMFFGLIPYWVPVLYSGYPHNNDYPPFDYDFYDNIKDAEDNIEFYLRREKDLKDKTIVKVI